MATRESGLDAEQPPRGGGIAAERRRVAAVDDRALGQGDLSEVALRKITYDNPRAFYGL